jgi:hypothetical protein
MVWLGAVVVAVATRLGVGGKQLQLRGCVPKPNYLN